MVLRSGMRVLGSGLRDVGYIYGWLSKLWSLCGVP